MRFEAGENEAGRRLDRVLKKILKDAPLSYIYKVIRKNVRVNNRRVPPETLLSPGDTIEIFLPDSSLRGGRPLPDEAIHRPPSAKQSLHIIYEDANILIVNKPYGLLTHGDSVEKKHTLTSQVLSYIAEKTPYTPGAQKTFTPAPANRLDRNTTGLVLFGKTFPAARDLALMMKGSDEGNDCVEKAYWCVVVGKFKEPMMLRARMTRDPDKNITKVLTDAEGDGRMMVTEAIPLVAGKGYTLVEARLLTGRTHQIRAQLAAAGFPIIGDRKYGDTAVNRTVTKKYGLQAQLLHAYRLTITNGVGSLEYLKGRTFKAKAPQSFMEIAEDLGCTKTETEKWTTGTKSSRDI